MIPITQSQLSFFVTNVFACFLLLFIVLAVHIYLAANLRIANAKLPKILLLVWQTIVYGMIFSGVVFIWLPA